MRKITKAQLATLKLSWALLRESQEEMNKVWFDINPDHIGNTELGILDAMLDVCERTIRNVIDRNGGNTND